MMLFAVLGVLAPCVFAAPVEPVWSLAQREKPALLETLKELVEAESGSNDIEGLNRIAGVIAARLRALSGSVELIEPGPGIYKMSDTPEKIGKMVRASFSGTGSKRILLLAHMDTVYPRGMLAQQPFKIEGDRAWGLGIADDKHGISVILHTVAILKAMNFRDYGVLTVLINGDEEISSPASRHVITKLGAEHDLVMSFEGGGDGKVSRLNLTTSGIALASLRVKGRAAHAGVRPEQGINALYELAHQILQARDLSDPAAGIKVNWTMARAGIVRNMIPPGAVAEADIRVQRVSDYDGIEQKLRERIKNKLLHEAIVEIDFERRRPPLEATAASRSVAEYAQNIYGELGQTLEVRSEAGGGGTDAAFAALKTKCPVVEGFGLQGFGSHSTNAEYILMDSIEPRLYLAARMIMDVSQGKTPLVCDP
ncbi:MAG: M20/M25/M40 family metallo-hydrolase [Burkholderiales bacterium]